MLFDNWEEFIPAPGASMWSPSTLPRPDWDISENLTTAAAETRESNAEWRSDGFRNSPRGTMPNWDDLDRTPNQDRVCVISDYAIRVFNELNIGGEEFIIVADPADDGTATPFAMVKDSGTGPQFTEPENEPIVVTGKRKAGGGVLFSDPFLPAEVVPPDDSGSVPSPGEEPAPLSYDDGVDVTINAKNLTPEQQQAVKDFLRAIDRMDKAIRALSDNAKITLYDGSVVTGAELKALWMKMDFVVNPDTVFYGDQNRGAAIYNGGDPIVYQNISTLTGYNVNGEAGMNYLVGHELGHLTQANMFHDGTNSDAGARYEQMANDISRAIANFGDLDVLSQSRISDDAPYPRYRTDEPLVFIIAAG